MGKPSDDHRGDAFHGAESDWVDADPTELTGVPLDAVPEFPSSEETTKPHGVARMLEEAYERGRREAAGQRASWFAEGQEDALGALRAEFHAGGWADGIVNHVVASVRSRLTRL